MHFSSGMRARRAAATGTLHVQHNLMQGGCRACGRGCVATHCAGAAADEQPGGRQQEMRRRWPAPCRHARPHLDCNCIPRACNPVPEQCIRAGYMVRSRRPGCLHAALACLPGGSAPARVHQCSAREAQQRLVRSHRAHTMPVAASRTCNAMPCPASRSARPFCGQQTAQLLAAVAGARAGAPGRPGAAPAAARASPLIGSSSASLRRCVEL